MVTVLETEFKSFQSLFKSLTLVYGIGLNSSKYICKILGFSKNVKINQLTEDQLLQVSKLVEAKGLVISSELKKFNSIALKKLVHVKSYRGLRRINGLPVRGQRTHTNAKTARKKF